MEKIWLFLGTKSPPVCLHNAGVPHAEDTKSNTPKCEKETKH